MNFDEVHRERDRRLRRLLLQACEYAKRYLTGGRIDGVTAADNAKAGLPEAQRFEDDEHAMSLLRDLENKGLIAIGYATRRRGERQALRHMDLKITARGTSLLNETLPVDPDVDDERIAEGA